jgi:hypothetical protein
MLLLLFVRGFCSDKDFFYSAVAAAERYRGLPDKFVDTNVVFLGQLIICLTIGVSVLYLKNLIVNSCVVPVFQIPEK